MTKLGKFEILAQLGEGAMGTVYRARDPILDREVALKTVSKGLLSRPDSVLRFQREARAAARLQHPNIVTIFELGEVEGTPFIAMELLEGHDLAQVVAQRERFSLGQRLRMVADVCRALDFAHKRGVVHRDVKPANIRVQRDGTVKLVDFGIARLGDSKMTQTGLVLGTPSYVAPEALMEGRVDHRADMWAVGVVLYELLTGRCPFEAGSIPALVYRIVREPHVPLDPVALGIPEAVAAVAERALRKAPAERFQDLAEMALALELGGGLSGPLEPVLSPTERARACQQSLTEAQRLLDANDLEGALGAARRAQALEPSRTDVVTLVHAIEERLEDAPTISGPAAPSPIPARQATPAPVHGPAAPRIGDELRRLGASAYRDLGAFGDPCPSQAACLCPAREELAICGADGAVRIWDLRTRSLARSLRTAMHLRSGHDSRALVVAYSGDGQWLASGHVDGAVHLWDATRGVEIQGRLRHDAMVGALAFSKDSRVLASGSTDATLKLWDVPAACQGEARRELLRQPSAVTSLAYAADGSWLATGHAGRVLRILHGGTHRLLATLRGPEAPVSLLLSAPDGRRLVVASQDRKVRVFDIPSREERLAFEPHRRPAASLAFVGEAVLASVGLDNAVRFWDLANGGEIAGLWGPADESFVSLAGFCEGRQIAVVLGDGRIRLWGPAV